MNPKITIDKEAIRFEDDEGMTNHFFQELFIGHNNWQMNVLIAIQKAYEICVTKNIQPEKIEEEESV